MLKKKKHTKIQMIGTFLLLTTVVGTILVYAIYSYSPPVYHEYFYSIKTRQNNGSQAVVRLDANSWAIIEVETGRELRHFRNGWYRYNNIYFLADGIIAVNRFREQIFGNELISRRAYLYVESGRRFIRGVHIEQIFNGMAIVREGFNIGVIDTETRRELVPFDFRHISPISDTMVLACLPWTEEDALPIGAAGVINVITGEEMLPFRHNYFIGMPAGNLIHVRNAEFYSAIIDLESGNEVIPFGFFARNSWIVLSEYGIAAVRLGSLGEWVIIDIASGNELVTLEDYRDVSIMSSRLVAVMERQPSRLSTQHGWGIIDIFYESEVVPTGKYSFSPSGYLDGMLVVRYNNEVAVMEAATGNKIIPFGRYEDIMLWPNGHIAVQAEGLWWFERICR